MASFVKVADESLYVSEPPAHLFGNPPDEVNDPTWTCKNWLKSRFHLNFAEHRGGENQYGVMRVMNDDLVQPHRGFGTHPHRNMEIITYIVEGGLTHQDSIGSAETLGRGGVQYMSAGSGIQHSEDNRGDTPLRFIQMWFLPSTQGLRPQYGGYAGDAEARKGKLQHIVSDSRGAVKTPVQVSQDLGMWASEVAEGEQVTFDLKEGRMAYLLCIDGNVACDGAHGSEMLGPHDAARIGGPNSLTITGKDAGGHFLLLEMAAAK
eukprot:m.206351 g.206351  ORF g.206351 m.206351 type:complete len:263 (-) comp25349_c0_seq1:118-906(-)